MATDRSRSQLQQVSQGGSETSLAQAIPDGAQGRDLKSFQLAHAVRAICFEIAAIREALGGSGELDVQVDAPLRQLENADEAIDAIAMRKAADALSEMFASLASHFSTNFAELAQDAVLAVIADSTDIDFTYDDIANAASLIVKAFTGDVTKSAGGTVLTIANDAVTLAKLANISTDRLIGRDTAGTGDPEEITVGGGLEFTGTGGIRRGAITGDIAVPAAGSTSIISTRLKTISRMLYIENPQATDVIPMCYLADAGTIIAIRSVTDAGTVTFNIEQRGQFTPGTAGVDCMTADQVADTNGEERTGSFNDPTVPADNWLVYAASAVSGAGKVWVSVEYTID